MGLQGVDMGGPPWVDLEIGDFTTILPPIYGYSWLLWWIFMLPAYLQ